MNPRFLTEASEGCSSHLLMLGKLNRAIWGRRGGASSDQEFHSEYAE